MREEGKYQNRKRITKIFCFILVFTFLCVSAGLLGLLNSNQSPKAEINVAVGAPINSDSWTSNSSYYIQPTLQDTGQSNSESNPYIIDSAEKLAYLSYDPSWADEKYFLQTANIDLNAHYWVPINNVADTSSSNRRVYYYDGGEHTISNIYINTTEQTLTSTNYIGLFGYVRGSSSQRAYIKKVNITSGSVNGNQYVGAIVGSGIYTDITDCSNQGVSITGSSYVGGIAGENSSSTISNCYNEGEITSSGSYVGGIAGYGGSNSNMNNCFNTGNIISTSTSIYSNVGGIMGNISQFNTLDGCYNKGNITSSGSGVGGIVGSGGGGKINNCYNEGAILSTSTSSNWCGVGGIVGDNSSTTIDNCYNEGSVTGSGGNIGGIVGYNEHYVINSYNLGKITGASFVAGIAGRIDEGVVKMCYNAGDIVSSGNYVGGIGNSQVVNNRDVGSVLQVYNTGNVKSTSTSSSSCVGGIMGRGAPSLCYNTGEVRSSGGYVGGISGSAYNWGPSACYNIGLVYGSSNVGGICGDTECAYGFYDKDVLTKSNSYGVALSRQQMIVTQKGVAPVDMKGFYDIEWIFNVGELPKLRMEDYTYGITERPTLQDPNSSNSESNPYIIDNEAKLAYLSENSSWAVNKYFLQTSDLDFSSYDYFVPINIDRVSRTGVFRYDGGNNTISNLKFNSGLNLVGLFAFFGDDTEGYVKNLTLFNADFSGGCYTGGVGGYVSSSIIISNCHNLAGNIEGGYYVGGIAGGRSGQIIRCSNESNIKNLSTSTSSRTGGICGNASKIEICSNKGTVSALNGAVGGITGEGKASGCYNIGSVTGTMENRVGGISGINGTSSFCYYDKNKVATSNEYGTPLTIEQMTVTQNGVAPELMQGFFRSEWDFKVGKTPIFLSDYNYGTTEEPIKSGNNYIIDSEAKLAYLSQNSDWASGKSFLQTKDLNFSSYEFFIPINTHGNKDRTYTYDGGNHTISNLNIETVGVAGIFGDIEVTIKNLKIVNGSITGSSAGGFVGRGNGEIINCVNENVTITGFGSVGGIVGYFTGDITNCGNTANVTNYGTGDTGGIAGWNTWDVISKSYNTGNISGNGRTGGIVGSGNVDVIMCYNTGNVTSTGDDVGGIGGGTDRVKLCYNTGNITGNENVGGICGGTLNEEISFCYNIGKVSGNKNVGGVLGEPPSSSYDGAPVYSYYDQNCVEVQDGYGTPLTLDEMTVTNAGKAPEKMIGFFVSEWLFVAGELPKLLMEDYVYGSTVQPTLQDNSQANSESNPYIIDSEAKLAYLSENSSWADEKYFLQTKNLDFSNYDYFVPINNSSSSRTYYYDGNNYTISNINITLSESYVGLFGRVYGTSSNYAYIKNVHLVNSCVGGMNYVGSIVGYANYTNIINCSSNGINVSGASNVGGILGYARYVNVIDCFNTSDIYGSSSGRENSRTGGIVGYMESGKIASCYNIGNVIATSPDKDLYAGGIAGYNYYNSTISNCYNTGDITSTSTSTSDDSYAGGIAGYNYRSIISNCYNTGTVTSTSTSSSGVGGIAGYNYYNSTISNCYNTGAVTGSSYVGGIAGSNSNSTISSCYNTGDVTSTSTGSSSYAGGIAGYNYYNSTISSCYNTGDVTNNSASSNSYTGGIAGYVEGYSSNKSLISSCFNAGAVSGNGYLGGVVGYIENSTSRPSRYVSISWCYYNTETVGSVVTKAIGYGTGYQVYGLTTAQMQGDKNQNYMYLSDTVWNFASGQYPTLKYVAQAEN